jgi:hypothetical protein
MSVSRAIEILEAWQNGTYSDDMVPPPPADSTLMTDDEFPLEIVRHLKAIIRDKSAKIVDLIEKRAHINQSSLNKISRDIYELEKATVQMANGGVYGEADTRHEIRSRILFELETLVKAGETQ